MFQQRLVGRDIQRRYCSRAVGRSASSRLLHLAITARHLALAAFVAVDQVLPATSGHGVGRSASPPVVDHSSLTIPPRGAGGDHHAGWEQEGLGIRWLLGGWQPIEVHHDLVDAVGTDLAVRLRSWRRESTLASGSDRAAAASADPRARSRAGRRRPSVTRDRPASDIRTHAIDADTLEMCGLAIGVGSRRAPAVRRHARAPFWPSRR